MHRRPSRSIRTSLVRDLVTVVVIVGLAVLATTFLGARRAVHRLSEVTVAQTLDTVEAHLETFFTTPAIQLDFLYRQAETGMFNDARLDPDELRVRRNSVLQPLIEANPQITSAMIADERGHEHMLLRTEDGWRNRVTGRGRAVNWTEWTDEDPVPRQRTEMAGFDPRERPWYEAATSDPTRAHWTEPYAFATTGEPGITIARTYDIGDGALRVIGLDVRLQEISRFTRSMHVMERGMAAVMNTDRRVIGLPRSARFDDPAARRAAYLKTPSELELTVVHDAAMAFREVGVVSGTLRFHSDGEAWWGRIQPFEISGGRLLRVAILVPEADLLGSLNTQRLTIGAILLIVLVIGVLRAIVLAGRFSRPIEALVEQSERISRGDLDSPVAVESNVTEVRRLADAHERMREGLQALIRLEKLERDLDLAREIQQGLLPSEPPVVDGFLVAGWNSPADQTGGDYYDWLTLPDGRVVVTLADVTGHGIGPALIVAVCRAYLRATTSFGPSDLGEAIVSVNDLLCADTPSERFVTAVVGIVDPATRRVTLSSAGHGPILHYVAAEDTVHAFPADTIPLAISPNMDPPPAHDLDFAAGDMIVLTTDGFFEWHDPDGEMYGTERLRKFVRDHRDLDPGDLIAELHEDVLRFSRGTDQADDLTAVVIKGT